MTYDILLEGATAWGYRPNPLERRNQAPAPQSASQPKPSPTQDRESESRRDQTKPASSGSQIQPPVTQPTMRTGLAPETSNLRSASVMDLGSPLQKLTQPAPLSSHPHNRAPIAQRPGLYDYDPNHGLTEATISLATLEAGASGRMLNNIRRLAPGKVENIESHHEGDKPDDWNLRWLEFATGNSYAMLTALRETRTRLIREYSEIDQRCRTADRAVAAAATDIEMKQSDARELARAYAHAKGVSESADARIADSTRAYTDSLLREGGASSSAEPGDSPNDDDQLKSRIWDRHGDDLRKQYEARGLGQEFDLLVKARGSNDSYTPDQMQAIEKLRGHGLDDLDLAMYRHLKGNRDAIASNDPDDPSIAYLQSSDGQRMAVREGVYDRQRASSQMSKLGEAAIGVQEDLQRASERLTHAKKDKGVAEADRNRVEEDLKNNEAQLQSVQAFHDRLKTDPEFKKAVMEGRQDALSQMPDSMRDTFLKHHPQFTPNFATGNGVAPSAADKAATLENNAAQAPQIDPAVTQRKPVAQAYAPA